MPNNKPTVFIGSSTESLPIAHVLQTDLSSDATIYVWDQGVFGVSDYTLDRLLTATKEFDFAIFVFGADDMLELKGKRYLVARDNVVLELGIFVGRLGRQRTFIVLQNTLEPVHLPTDLQGITTARFSWEKGVPFKGNYTSLHAELGPVTQSIREAVAARGIEDGILKPLSGGMIFLALWLKSRSHSLHEIDQPFQSFQEKTGRLGPGDKAYAAKAAKYACQCLEAVGMAGSAGGNEYFLTPLGIHWLDSEKLRQRFSNVYKTFDELKNRQ